MTAADHHPARSPPTTTDPNPDKPDTERHDMTQPDPRARQLAEAVHGLARQKATRLPAWQDLPISERDKATTEARLWLRAAVEAGIAPPA